jgi:hypothetical protein
MEPETRREGRRRDDVAALRALILGVSFHLLLAGAYTPPDVEPMDAPLERFSAQRALPVLQRLLGPEPEPHPWASGAAKELRERLIEELHALGLDPQVQSAETTPEQILVGQVHNVLARIEGNEGGATILCMAHYDSVPAGTGVGDDLAGVAALLEVARAVQHWSEPRHSLVFLFTDGEEAGLLGARAFAADHPWMKEVELVVNVEGRGTSGPSHLFETGEGDGWLIEAFAREARRPVTSSLAREVYKAMPNDTDFSVFRDRRRSGANFAFMENVGRYHTPLDTLENFDLRSLQHHGENVAAVLRSVWDLDLKEHPHSERVWFDVAARGVVSWPSAWSTPLALLALLSVLAALRRAHTSGRSRAGPVVASAVIGIGVVALSGFAGRGVASALSAASGVQVESDRTQALKGRHNSLPHRLLRPFRALL